MVTRTLRGVIRNGRIEPAEKLDAPEGTEVTISVPVQSSTGTMIKLGMFSGALEHMSTEEAFQEARRSIWGQTDA